MGTENIFRTSQKKKKKNEGGTEIFWIAILLRTICHDTVDEFSPFRRAQVHDSIFETIFVEMINNSAVLLAIHSHFWPQKKLSHCLQPFSAHFSCSKRRSILKKKATWTSLIQLVLVGGNLMQTSIDEIYS